MAKKENRMKKREEELRELIRQREMRFRRRGIVSVIVVVVCAAAMYLLNEMAADTNWGQALILVLSAVMILAFIFSVINSMRRMLQMHEENKQ